ncbi:MAG: segregation/condensation protein A [Hormoscilla sp. SP12CHS1]|nr:segregation/condensation protein A [Hormoscilla sp. SP12CHS1]
MRDSQITYRPEEIGIALLIDMAQRGEIDPWDVQVIDVIDRVLSQLSNSNDDTTTVEADLSQSGQVFLYASMLVLLKADSLAPAPETSEMFPEVLESEDSSDGSLKQKLPLHLERQLRRRAVARPPQQRRVTLQELIDQLQLMTKTIAQQQKRIPTRRKSSLSRAEAADAITQLAHQENLSEVAEQLEYFLANNWSKMAQGSDWLNLEQLLAWQPQQDKVGVFWALLLLSAQSKVELAQEEFYQDLKIRSTL